MTSVLRRRKYIITTNVTAATATETYEGSEYIHQATSMSKHALLQLKILLAHNFLRTRSRYTSYFATSKIIMYFLLLLRSLRARWHIR